MLSVCQGGILVSGDGSSSVSVYELGCLVGLLSMTRRPSAGCPKMSRFLAG